MSRIIFNRKITTGYHKMRIFCPEVAPKAKPGQFVMVKVADTLDPLLRRPFAIHRVCHETGTKVQAKAPSCIEILYRTVGKGTVLLSRRTRNEIIDLMGPLGNGFCLEHGLQAAVLVAGGIGIAPLFFLAQAVGAEALPRVANAGLFAFLGGRTSTDILCRSDLKRIGAAVEVSTEDGSLGEKGMVTEPLTAFFAKRLPAEMAHLSLFACGPLPMLRSVSEIARVRGVPCQVSLETRMACGVGACLGCGVPVCSACNGTVTYQRACREGPVFDSSAIMWDSAHFFEPCGKFLEGK